jgi:hypothetical protein
VPLDTLLDSLDAARVEADIQAKPVFIDDQPMGRTTARSSASAVSDSQRWHK